MSTSDVAATTGSQQPTETKVKQQGTQTAQGAKHAGQRVAHTAMEQGRQVVQETRDKARGMADQAQTQLQQQVGEQQKRAAGSLHDLGEQLRSMADKTEQSGLATDLVQQASGRVQQMRTGWTGGSRARRWTTCGTSPAAIPGPSSPARRLPAWWSAG